MSEAPPELDTEELKQLALQAIQADRTEDAIRLLKEALFRSPERADLRYLLGAMHAQIGLVARGIEEIAEAVALAPGLHPARFQLGLLHFSRGEYEQAESVWAPLHEALAEDDALHLFVLGLERLAREDFDGCLAWLHRGLERSKSENLNADMRRLVGDVEAMQGARAAAGETAPVSAEPAASRRHVLLSRYQQQDEGS